MKLLGELFDRAVAAGLSGELPGARDLPVAGLSYDSRSVGAGDLFFALPGTHVDGRVFLDTAIAAGATAVVVQGPFDPDRMDPTLKRAFGWIDVEDAMTAAGLFAAAWYEEPAATMELAGITGTNGKTSCSYLLESVWRAAGRQPGVIGTIRQRCAAFDRPSPMTTPPAIDVQALLAEMRDAGTDAVAIEVSSHALAQKRVAGCAFRVALFTNLTRDHLDYHGDEESYFAAKAALFRDYLAPGGAAVLNADDPRAARLASELRGSDVWLYSTGPATRARASVLEADVSLDGIRARFLLDDFAVSVSSPLVGHANLSNLLAVAAAAAAVGIEPQAIERGLSECPPIPGRMERIGTAKPVVLVDYAHTPDALERSLVSLREDTEGRLIVVFGCGGNRDRGKRAMMGKIAAENADVVVLTSDNPRGEDPNAIIADIETGVALSVRARTRCRREPTELRATGECGYSVEPVREEAIRHALELADTEDVVLVAGKGHEDYQEAAGVRRAFDDRKVVAELLSEDGKC